MSGEDSDERRSGATPRRPGGSQSAALSAAWTASLPHVLRGLDQMGSPRDNVTPFPHPDGRTGMFSSETQTDERIAAALEAIRRNIACARALELRWLTGEDMSKHRGLLAALERLQGATASATERGLTFPATTVTLAVLIAEMKALDETWRHRADPA